VKYREGALDKTVFYPLQFLRAKRKFYGQDFVFLQAIVLHEV
jgi:hypothetical protein